MKLEGALIAIAGDITGYTREELEIALKERGATVQDAISMETTALLTGEEAGRLEDQAREMGVRVVGQELVRDLLDGKSIHQPVDDAYYALYEGMDQPDVPDHVIYEEAYAMPPEPGYLPATPKGGRKKPGAKSKEVEQDGDRVFQKGDLVKIVGGREGVGVVGKIFWWGDSKYGEGMRAGVSGDGEDESYWVDEANLGWPDDEIPEQVIKKAQEGAQFRRGDTVRVTTGRDEGAVGQIFWWGESRYGEGMRAGIETSDGDKVWADAAHLAKVDAGDMPAPAQAPASRAPVYDPIDDDDIPF